MGFVSDHLLPLRQAKQVWTSEEQLESDVKCERYNHHHSRVNTRQYERKDNKHKHFSDYLKLPDLHKINSVQCRDVLTKRNNNNHLQRSRSQDTHFRHPRVNELSQSTKNSSNIQIKTKKSSLYSSWDNVCHLRYHDEDSVQKVPRGSPEYETVKNQFLDVSDDEVFSSETNKSKLKHSNQNQSVNSPRASKGLHVRFSFRTWRKILPPIKNTGAGRHFTI